MAAAGRTVAVGNCFAAGIEGHSRPSNVRHYRCNYRYRYVPATVAAVVATVVATVATVVVTVATVAEAVAIVVAAAAIVAAAVATVVAGHSNCYNPWRCYSSVVECIYVVDSVGNNHGCCWTVGFSTVVLADGRSLRYRPRTGWSK